MRGARRGLSAREQAEAERLRIEAEKAAEAKRLADEKAAAEKKKKVDNLINRLNYEDSRLFEFE